MSRYGHVRHRLLSLLFLLYADINSYSSLVSAYGSNFRRRTVLLADTFSNYRGCPLTRELSPIKLTTNSHSYKIYVSSFTFSPKFVFSFVWQANGIEMRPILCSIQKIRFLCNFTGPPLENCCIFFLSFSNTNIPVIKFGEKILKEKNKCFEVKKLVNFKHCRLSYVVVYICTPSHRNTCIRFQ